MFSINYIHMNHILFLYRSHICIYIYIYRQHAQGKEVDLLLQVPVALENPVPSSSQLTMPLNMNAHENILTWIDEKMHLLRKQVRVSYPHFLVLHLEDTDSIHAMIERLSNLTPF